MPDLLYGILIGIWASFVVSSCAALLYARRRRRKQREEEAWSEGRPVSEEELKRVEEADAIRQSYYPPPPDDYELSGDEGQAMTTALTRHLRGQQIPTNDAEGLMQTVFETSCHLWVEGLWYERRRHGPQEGA